MTVISYDLRFDRVLQSRMRPKTLNELWDAPASAVFQESHMNRTTTTTGGGDVVNLADTRNPNFSNAQAAVSR